MICNILELNCGTDYSIRNGAMSVSVQCLPLLIPLLPLSHLPLLSTPHLPRRFTRHRFLWRWIMIRRRSSSVSEERCHWRWVSVFSPCFPFETWCGQHHLQTENGNVSISMIHIQIFMEAFQNLPLLNKIYISEQKYTWGGPITC